MRPLPETLSEIDAAAAPLRRSSFILTVNMTRCPDAGGETASLQTACPAAPVLMTTSRGTLAVKRRPPPLMKLADGAICFLSASRGGHSAKLPSLSNSHGNEMQIRLETERWLIWPPDIAERGGDPMQMTNRQSRFLLADEAGSQ